MHNCMETDSSIDPIYYVHNDLTKLFYDKNFQLDQISSRLKT